MKNKIREFLYSFVLYCLIVLAWNDWDVSKKQFAEMIVIAVLGGVFVALVMDPIKRFIARVLTKK